MAIRRESMSSRFRTMLITAAIVSVTGLFLTPGVAQAAATCNNAGAVVTVQLPNGGDAGSLAVAAGDIELNGSQCGTATDANTTTITISGGAGDQSLTINTTTFRARG